VEGRVDRPEPGLIHYVESGQLIVPWKEHKAFPKEEENEERLWEHNTRHGYKVRSPLIAAVEEVFASVGDDVQFYRGVLGGPAETIDRVKARAGIASGARSPVAYVNRQGSLRLPIDEALEIARKLCATEPTSARSNRSKRTRMGSGSPPPGGEYLVDLLDEYRAALALIRQWTGYDPAVAPREAEIQKLEHLVWDAIYALQKAGLDSDTARPRRAIQ
jgi:hypothetical protein